MRMSSSSSITKTVGSGAGVTCVVAAAHAMRSVRVRQADMETGAAFRRLVAQIRPPWASTIERLIDRPMPMPSGGW